MMWPMGTCPAGQHQALTEVPWDRLEWILGARHRVPLAATTETQLSLVCTRGSQVFIRAQTALERVYVLREVPPSLRLRELSQEISLCLFFLDEFCLVLFCQYSVILITFFINQGKQVCFFKKLNFSLTLYHIYS